MLSHKTSLCFSPVCGKSFFLSTLTDELTFLLTNSFFDELELVSTGITFSLLVELELLVDVATDGTILISEEDELLCSLETLEVCSLLELLLTLEVELTLELSTELELLELGILDEELDSCCSLELLELDEVLSAFVTELELLKLELLELTVVVSIWGTLLETELLELTEEELEVLSALVTELEELELEELDTLELEDSMLDEELELEGFELELLETELLELNCGCSGNLPKLVPSKS